MRPRTREGSAGLQVSVQATLPRGRCDPAGPTVLEVLRAGGDAGWSFFSLPQVNTAQTVRILEQSLSILCDNYPPFEKELLGLLLGLSAPHHELPSYHVT